MELSMKTIGELPLSALIESLHESRSDDGLSRLLDLFECSSVGIVVLNAPSSVACDGRRATSSGIALGTTRHGDGRARIIAFAEPVRQAKQG